MKPSSAHDMAFVFMKSLQRGHTHKGQADRISQHPKAGSTNSTECVTKQNKQNPMKGHEGVGGGRVRGCPGKLGINMIRMHVHTKL